MGRVTILLGVVAVGLVATLTTAVATPVPRRPPEDDAARLRRLYGTPADPDEDCTIELLKGDALRLAMPASRHTVEAAPGRMNAPHTWAEVKGDFTATVRVGFPIRPDPPPRDSIMAKSNAA